MPIHDPVADRLLAGQLRLADEAEQFALQLVEAVVEVVVAHARSLPD